MSTMSPELALVDPELRADAVARLPPIYVNAFLEFPEAPVRPMPAAARREVPRASAVAAYLLITLARTFVFEAAVFAAVAVLVLIASLLS
jgi:hypothetical protein